MVSYRKHGLRMAELWLDTPVDKPRGCDLLVLHQYSRLPREAFSWPFCTLTINLHASEAQLQEGLNRDTRYKVRRAASKDGVACVDEPATEAVCDAFRQFYDAFAAAKGLALLSPEELSARARGGTLRFSRALWQGETVVWHVHAVTADKASLLHSASQFRQLDDNDARAVIGRANRLLHWHDMLALKAAGVAVYDFGGWYAGDQDQDLLRINQFKEGFGGQRTEQFNGGIALTWRGWVYLTLRRYFSASQRKHLKARLRAMTQLKGSH